MPPVTDSKKATKTAATKFTSGNTNQVTHYVDPKTKTNESFWADTKDSLDLRYGGQWGLLPLIGGADGNKPIAEWMYEQSYQRMDVIPIVLQTPKMFDLLPNAAYWHEAIKSIFEVHARTIDGLNASLTVNTGEHNLGVSGATVKEVTQVTREATNVTLGLDERTGLPFETLFDIWIRYGLDDPDAGHPLITRVGATADLPKHWTAEWYSCTVLFIEPDRLRRKVNHAWLVSDLKPLSNPDIIGKKDKSAGRELKQLSIDFGGFALPPTNKRVKQLAETVLGIIKPWEKDPEDMLLPANEVVAGLVNDVDLGIYYEGVKRTTKLSETEEVGADSQITGIGLDGKKTSASATATKTPATTK